MENEKKEIGYAQMKAIISEIMDFQTFPKWDFVNGVLSAPEILGDFELWFHWGKLLMVPKEDKYAGKTAGDFEELDDWNTMPDGTMVLIGRKWRNE